MKNAGLFAPHLADLTPSSLRRLGRSAAATTSATNQQLLDAARAQYALHSVAVDATARQGSLYVKSPDGSQHVKALNAYDWKSGRADPSIARPVYSSPELSSAVASARDDAALASMVIGVSESLTLLVGESGGIGVGFDLGGQKNVAGVGFAEGRFGIDIEIGLNLQLGLWAGPVKGLAGDFLGLEVDVPVGEIVGLSLGIYMNQALELAGFTISLGVGVGGGAVIVSGTTWVF